MPLDDYHLVWNWSPLGTRIGESALVLDDLDGDGRDEILVTTVDARAGGSDLWFEIRQSDHALLSWSPLPSVAYEERIRDIAVLGGSPKRIGLAYDYRIELVDGISKSQTLELSVPGPVRSIVFTDIDGDGSDELVVCNEDDLLVFDAETGLPEAVKFGFGCQELLVGQLDGDPTPELVLAGNVSGGFVLDGGSLDVEWAHLSGFGSALAVGDIDGDSYEEIACACGPGASLQVLEPGSGSIRWSELSLLPTAIAIADVMAAPGSELIVGEESHHSLSLLSGANGQLLTTIEGASAGVTRVVVGDPDGDGLPELVWGSGRAQTVPDVLQISDPQSLEPHLATIDVRPPVIDVEVGELTQSGKLEVWVGLQRSSGGVGGSAVAVLNLDDGNLDRSTHPGWAGGFGELAAGMVVGQIDEDTSAEVCFGGNWKIACYDGGTFDQMWTRYLDVEHVWSVAFGEGPDVRPSTLLVGTNRNRVSAFQAETGELLWHSGPPSGGFHTAVDEMVVLDLAGDSDFELVAGRSGFTSLRLSTFRVSDGVWLGEVSGIDDRYFGTRPHPVQPGDELLISFETGEIAPLDPISGARGESLTLLPEPGRFRMFDMDGDGVLDLVAFVGRELQVINGVSGQIVWTSPSLGRYPESGDVLEVGDFDGDGVAEILASTYTGLALFEAPLETVLASGFETGDISEWTSSVPVHAVMSLEPRSPTHVN